MYTYIITTYHTNHNSRHLHLFINLPHTTYTRVHIIPNIYLHYLRLTFYLPPYKLYLTLQPALVHQLALFICIHISQLPTILTITAAICTYLPIYHIQHIPNITAAICTYLSIYHIQHIPAYTLYLTYTSTICA